MLAQSAVTRLEKVPALSCAGASNDIKTRPAVETKHVSFLNLSVDVSRTEQCIDCSPALFRLNSGDSTHPSDTLDMIMFHIFGSGNDDICKRIALTRLSQIWRPRLSGRWALSFHCLAHMFGSLTTAVRKWTPRVLFSPLLEQVLLSGIKIANE